MKFWKNVIVGFKDSLINLLSSLILFIPNLLIGVGGLALTISTGNPIYLSLFAVSILISLALKGYFLQKWKGWLFK